MYWVGPFSFYFSASVLPKQSPEVDGSHIKSTWVSCGLNELDSVSRLVVKLDS